MSFPSTCVADQSIVSCLINVRPMVDPKTNMPQVYVESKTRDYDIQAKGQAPEVFIAEQHAQMARLRGEKELQLAATNIQTEYKKRLEETKGLATRLEKQLSAVRAELAAAAASRTQLVGVLTKVQCPLQLTMDWSAIRGNARPQSPSSENINRALKQSSHDLKGAIETLTTHLVGIDQSIAGLKLAEQRFVDELRSKASTMVLDRACLEDGSLGLRPHQSLLASGQSSPRSPASVSPSVASTSGAKIQRALLTSHGLHTENEWRNQTNVSLSGGVIAVEESMKMRKAVATAIKGVEEGGRTIRPACVVDAVQAHARYEQQQLTSLKYNARMALGEIATLDKHTAVVSTTLAKVREQMQNAEHRLNLQSIRPASEATRTGVEEVLEIEVINMRRTEQTLVKQLQELELKRQRITALKLKIDAETAQRTDSLQLDQACTDMTLPTLPQIADRYRSKGGASPRDTPRASPRQPASSRRR
jgi:hypothetical protein